MIELAIVLVAMVLIAAVVLVAMLMGWRTRLRRIHAQDGNQPPLCVCCAEPWPCATLGAIGESVSS